MATAIMMPSLAPSMTEANLIRWLKREGDAVKAGEVLAEIETDKALVEYEAPAEGVLDKILVPDGTSGVQVGATIAWLIGAGEAPSAAGPSAAGVAVAPVTAEPPAAQPARALVDAAPLDSPSRVRSSPLARRIAQQHGIALEGLRGSGPNGRIVRVDVEAAVRAAGKDAAPAVAAPIVPAHVAPAAPTTLAPATSVAAGAPSAAAPALAATGYEEIPHTSTRRVIAQRLCESKREAPHFYLTIDCQLDALLELSAQINTTREHAKLSVNDFVVRAVALALRRVPAANASWTDTAVRRWNTVDISVAVATPAGLITPVVRDADRKTIGMLSDEIRTLAQRARDGKLLPAEYQGGGFSISNLGMYGVREFAAILNPPQACILAVGAAEERPVVRAGALAVATVMTCTLSVDHRVVDGAVGAEFLAALKSLLEQPLALLV